MLRLSSGLLRVAHSVRGDDLTATAVGLALSPGLAVFFSF